VQTSPGASSVANIQMLMLAVDQQLGVPLIFVFVRNGENLSENCFAEKKKEKKSAKLAHPIGCVVHLRLRSKWGKCDRKSFRLEPT
jgi:hypothetical protein